MKIILLVLVNLIVSLSFGQLNCKTIKLSNGSSEKKCFHKNGKISVLEAWDKDLRSGSIRAYNAEGKELFFHDLRNFGGHASVQLEYFSNGQVSKMYFSDAPDGGIQYYNSTTHYDESGNQTDFTETKYPFELKTFMTEPVEKEIPKKEETETPKEPVMRCPVIFSTIYQIQNSTDSRLKINVKALANNAVKGVDKEVILEPLQTLVLDTIFMADQFISVRVYQPELLRIETKSRKNKKIKIIESVPNESATTRTYYWFFVKE